MGSDIRPHSSSSVSSSSGSVWLLIFTLVPKTQPLVPLISVFWLCACLSLVRRSTYVSIFLVQRWARDLRSSSLDLSKPMQWVGQALHVASAQVTLVSSLCIDSFHIKHRFRHHFFKFRLLEVAHSAPILAWCSSTFSLCVVLLMCLQLHSSFLLSFNYQIQPSTDFNGNTTIFNSVSLIWGVFFCLSCLHLTFQINRMQF